MVMTTQPAPPFEQTAGGYPDAIDKRAGSDRDGPNRDAAEHAVQATSTHLHFDVGDTYVDITGPPLEKLAFYLGITGAAAFGLIEWPMAALTGIGHLLSDDRGNRARRALGDALDAA